MKLGKLLTVTVLATGVALGAFVDSADAMRRRRLRYSGYSNIFGDSTDLGNNPDGIKFDLVDVFEETEFGNNDPDRGVFSGAIKNFTFPFPFDSDLLNSSRFSDPSGILSVRRSGLNNNILSIRFNVSDTFSTDDDTSFEGKNITARIRYEANIRIGEKTVDVNDLSSVIDLIENDFKLSPNNTEFCLSSFVISDNKSRLCDNLFSANTSATLDYNSDFEDFLINDAKLNPDLVKDDLVVHRDGEGSAGFILQSIEEEDIPDDTSETIPEPSSLFSLIGLGIIGLRTFIKKKHTDIDK